MARLLEPALSLTHTPGLGNRIPDKATHPDQFGVAIMSNDGQLLELGRTETEFSMQSACKPFNSSCSLELNAREMATAAATLANNGGCPITQERVLEESTIRHRLTMMQMCGMNDGSGEFSLKIGLPAKSGVGGAVILVAPRLRESVCGRRGSTQSATAVAASRWRAGWPRPPGCIYLTACRRSMSTAILPFGRRRSACTRPHSY